MLALFSALLLVAAPGDTVRAIAGPAQASAAAPAQTDLKPGQRRVKVICETEVPTGTRFAKRHCMSLDAAKKRREESEKAWADIQSRPVFNGAKGN